ncbi:cation transporter [Croceitalea rosinachiae]|uniref:Cation transporter n=1 Tax=Croceitalea rosinachiae TaxID=3075596 RepID=A0ABU3AE29_9FLAO|nr:cation transporter [Croceitalea sp. F388]MDT0607772.1 cation transporter [Croceitalea sp. F388]
MKTQLARIQVQNAFCTNCKNSIKSRLSDIKSISNIQLYVTDSLVVFNFLRANELSDVLNVLSEIGHPEIGERYSGTNQVTSKLCLC